MVRHRIAAGRRPVRARLAALGLAVAATVAGAGIAVGGAPAQAAGPVEPLAVAAPPDATTTTVTAGDRTLTVSARPVSGLPPSGAQLTVAGSGFDPEHDLWIAVCEDDGAAPAALVHCVGGAIPENNASTGWGVVTSAKEPPYPGPVTTSWKKDGSFKLTLHLPSAMSEDADCVSAPCSVYTRSSDNSDRSEDVRVPVSFAAPPGESSSSTTSSETSSSASSVATTPTTSSSSLEPTTSTIGVIPTTVEPEIVLKTSAEAGTEQTVLFAGFTPGEKVDVTLYSDPVTLPVATADPTGNVRISFTVPKTLTPGEHLLQAIGRTSGRVGIAQFSVGAAVTSTVSAAASSTSTTTSASSAETSTPASDVASQVVVSSVTQQTSSAPVSTTVASPSVTESAAVSSSVAPGAAGADGNRLLWLWIVLAVLIIVGGAAGVVAMVRHRRETDDDLPDRAVSTPPAPGWSAGGGSGAQQPMTPPHGTAHDPATSVDPGGFGLLSGRDHPDGPVLYSGGQWPDRPTSVIGGQPGDPGGTGPSTEQWRPDFTSPTQVSPTAPDGGAPQAGDDGGPSTQQWRPDFGEPPTTGPEPTAPESAGPEATGPGEPGDATAGDDRQDDGRRGGGRHRTE